jgi:alanyl-tRNA synthetase
MYDTYGFPLDLTVLMCEEKGMTVDTDGYEKEMELAKQKAKEGGNFSADEAIAMAAEEVDQLKSKMGVPPTDDGPKYNWASAAGTGEPLSSTLRGILNTKKVFLDKADADSGLVGLITEATPYYAEAGGQVADVGTITTASGGSFKVTDVKKVGPYVVHVGTVSSGALSLSDAVTLTVDFARRAPIAKNHTTTHMLNFALIGALGQKCEQRGALYDDEKLRFDFAYGKPLTPEQLQDTQDRVNKQIKAGLPIQVQESPLEAAKAVNGLRAVFGEQYPDPVRVVAVGGPGIQAMMDDPEKAEWAEMAIEFCGGTHIATSSEAGEFALLSEEGLGRGVRRILGVTHEKAKTAFAEAKTLYDRCTAAEKLTGAALEKEAAELVQIIEKAVLPAADAAKIRGMITALKKKLLEADKGAAKAAAEAAKVEAEALATASAEDVKCIIALLTAEADAKALEGAMGAVTAKRPKAAVLLIGAGKTAAALAVVPKELEGTLNAKDWVNEALQACGGKGGGKPGRAQGAARDPSNAKEAEAKAKAFASSKLEVEIS